MHILLGLVILCPPPIDPAAAERSADVAIAEARKLADARTREREREVMLRIGLDVKTVVSR